MPRATQGSGNTDAIIVDTVNPTLAIAFTESALSDGETSGVTFTFSEAQVISLSVILTRQMGLSRRLWQRQIQLFGLRRIPE
ncbi:hypothetical protein FR932_02705 [Moritella marina ATCC 15381]|uniref:Bacterial Ig-like domain-containing protein n=1 Tax=Moritella marina ATCC 15381 TaxID=1202962 RepID=A0A5J6WI19_MORMI|nr:Ig-like domain-containing protein [Moritella marina]QFI36821.1 hypothetical protein FR932_02705 [Moritella marina ATCC 15381]